MLDLGSIRSIDLDFDFELDYDLSLFNDFYEFLCVIAFFLGDISGGFTPKLSKGVNLSSGKLTSMGLMSSPLMLSGCKKLMYSLVLSKTCLFSRLYFVVVVSYSL